MYQDRSLTCRDCAEEFVFSGGRAGLLCQQESGQRSAALPVVSRRGQGARNNEGPREFHAAVCGACGGQAVVPFAPRNDRPVYCSSCFDKVRAGTLDTCARMTTSERAMADPLVTTGAPTTTFDRRPAVSPAGEILATSLGAGSPVSSWGSCRGPRRPAGHAVGDDLHEDTVGLTTENGEVIGNISFNGTMALITFGGLGMGLVAGTIWVIVSPWIPGRGMARAFMTAIAAIALGIPPLVQRTNPDFALLGYDPIVIVLLIGLVGLVGFSIALVDDALDARLPPPFGGDQDLDDGVSDRHAGGPGPDLPLVISILLQQSEYSAPIRAGWALAVVGACTLIWWVLRAKGRSAPPEALRLAGTVSLLVAVVLGVVTSLPHIIVRPGS